MIDKITLMSSIQVEGQTSTSEEWRATPAQGEAIQKFVSNMNKTEASLTLDFVAMLAKRGKERAEYRKAHPKAE